MKLHCPHCGVKGAADDSYLGRNVKCPKCQGVFVVADDSSAERPEDAASFSAPAAMSEPLSPARHEEPMPARKDEDFDESGPIAALSADPAVEKLDFEGDVTESDTVMWPPAQQSALDDDSFNLDDIAAEIEMQLAAGEAAVVPEEIPDGSPVDIGSLEDAFEQPTAGETVAPEIVAITGNYSEERIEDAVQHVEETAAVAPAPVESVAPSPTQPTAVPDATAAAGNTDESQASFGATVKKIWTKIKAALFS